MTAAEAAPAAARGRSGGASGLLIAAVALAALVPLLVTPVFPFVDFYAHVARYYVLARADEVASLAEHYAPAWALLPNLGLDILATGLMEALPPRRVAWIIAFLMLALPFCGVLALSRVLHGHVPLPGLLLAGILIYSHILIWGFANFLIGIGTAFLGLALWLALAPRPGWQLGLSAALGVGLLFVHGLAFALWGLLLGTVELMRAREAGEWHWRGLAALARRMLRLVALAVIPALLFTQMQTSDAEGGVTQALDNLAAHAAGGGALAEVFDEIGDRLDHSLRVADSTWPWIDRALGLVLWGGLAAGLFTGVLRLDRRLWLAAGLAALLIVVTPPNLFGVGYVDDRMPLLLLMVLAAGVSLRPAPDRTPDRTPDRAAQRLMLGLSGLMVLRLALVTTGWHADGQVYRGYLQALETAETGAMGVAALFDETGDRDAPRPRCKPLSFLMLLENDTAVATFANPTQQPLALAGPLRAARDAPGADPQDRAQVLTALAGRGYDSIVACDARPPGPPPPGLTVLAAEPPWTLYGVARDAPRP